MPLCFQDHHDPGVAHVIYEASDGAGHGMHIILPVVVCLIDRLVVRSQAVWTSLTDSVERRHVSNLSPGKNSGRTSIGWFTQTNL